MCQLLRPNAISAIHKHFKLHRFRLTLTSKQRSVRRDGFKTADT